MATRAGAPNGPRLLPFDRWFRYPAGFSAATLDLALASLRLTAGALLIDPFAGAGTAGVRATEYGLGFRGLEAHSEIAELANTKFHRPGDPTRLTALGRQVVSGGQPVANFEAKLVVSSFGAAELASLVSIREAIQELRGDPWYLHLKWALLGALRDTATAKVGWPYQRPAHPRVPRIADPRRAFLRRLEWMVEDIRAHPRRPDAVVHAGDARADDAWQRIVEGVTPSAALTSPPYLNNFDYADATRLELYFWRAASSWAEMVTKYRTPMLTATTQQSSVGVARDASTALASRVPAVSRTIDGLVDRLCAERASRPRGKEYDLVIPAYFEGVTSVFEKLARWAPGVRVALIVGDSAPYGVYVDTPVLIADALQELGYDFESSTPIRARGIRWHSNGSRHRVPLNERLLVLSAPRVA